MACGAECLQVGVAVVVCPSGVVDVVDFEVLSAGVVVSAVLAGVAVAAEDCVSGCGRDVFCVVVPGHRVLGMRKPPCFTVVGGKGVFDNRLPLLRIISTTRTVRQV